MRPDQLHVIFDLDGTVFDTEFETSRITAAIANERGCAVSDEDVFCSFAGLGCDAKFNGIAVLSGVTFTRAQLDEMEYLHESRKQEIYHRDSIPVVPGIPQAVRQLADAGHVLSIGSSNPSARSRLGLGKEGLLDYFEPRIYGPDLVGGLKKPDPAVFLKAMAEQGSTPQNTVVVEDTEAGIQAGRAAGAFVVAYLDPRFGTGAAAQAKTAEFKKSGANVVIRSFDALCGCLPNVQAGKTPSRHPGPAA